MQFSPLIDQLIKHMCCLPGVGPKSAQRMVLHLLTHDRDSGQRLASSLQTAMGQVQHCQQCRNFCEEALCPLCQASNRQQDYLCIVENPADVIAIEQTHIYRGLYFVLMGHLSPIDNIGPKELGLEQLQQRVQQQRFSEVIIATNPTVEGEATAHYLWQLLKPHVQYISRIAHGVPVGGELEYVDGGTLSKSIQRRELLDA